MRSADVAIIGGAIIGSAAAYFIKQLAPVIGRWSGRMENFLVAAGFSGHGMMHAPAAGRAIAELIVHGRYETLDLTRLGYRRIEERSAYRERGIL